MADADARRAPLLSGSVPPPCCPPTAHGIAESVAPSADGGRNGAFIMLRGDEDRALPDLEVYVAEPPPDVRAKGAVIVIHDIFGARVGRHAQICEDLAAAGFYAACPDLFGDAQGREAANMLPRWPLKQARNILELLCCCKAGYFLSAQKRSWDGEIVPALQRSMAHVQARHAARAPLAPPLKWAAVGFCWGAKPVARLLSGEGGAAAQVGCGIAFHPSLRGGEAERHVGAVARPMMLCPAHDDPANVQPGGALAEPLETVFARQGAAPGAFTNGFAAVRPFPHMLHGFMTRGPLSDPAIATSYTEGVQLMVDFFTAFSEADSAHDFTEAD